jgi:hypothetical protein
MLSENQSSTMPPLQVVVDTTYLDVRATWRSRLVSFSFALGVFLFIVFVSAYSKNWRRTGLGRRCGSRTRTQRWPMATIRTELGRCRGSRCTMTWCRPAATVGFLLMIFTGARIAEMRKDRTAGTLPLQLYGESVTWWRQAGHDGRVVFSWLIRDGFLLEISFGLIRSKIHLHKTTHIC